MRSGLPCLLINAKGFVPTDFSGPEQLCTFLNICSDPSPLGLLSPENRSRLVDGVANILVGDEKPGIPGESRINKFILVSALIKRGGIFEAGRRSAVIKIRDHLSPNDMLNS